MSDKDNFSVSNDKKSGKPSIESIFDEYDSKSLENSRSRISSDRKIPDSKNSSSELLDIFESLEKIGENSVDSFDEIDEPNFEKSEILVLGSEGQKSTDPSKTSEFHLEDLKTEKQSDKGESLNTTNTYDFGYKEKSSDTINPSVIDFSNFEEPKPSESEQLSEEDEALKMAFGDDEYDRITKQKKSESNKDLENAFNNDKFASYDWDEDDKHSRKRKAFLDEPGKPEYEFTSSEDTAKFTKLLRKKLVSSCLSFFVIAILSIVCLLVEIGPAIGLPHMRYLEPGKFGLIYSLVDLQLLLFAAMPLFESLYKGALSLKYGEATPASVSLILTLTATIHTIIMIFVRQTATDLKLFCSVACFSLLLLSLHDFLLFRSKFLSFRIATANTAKYGIYEVEDTPESCGFNGIVPDSSKIFDIIGVKFISKFFERHEEKPKSDRKLGLYIAITAVLSIIFAIVYFFTCKNIIASINAAVIVFFTSTPASLFAVSALPYFINASAAYKMRSAFIGQASVNEYEDTSVLFFSDTEVFPPKNTKVSSIRTYGNNRIDNVIVYMARIFKKLDGPLSVVFANSLQNIVINPDLKLVDVAPDGLWVEIDGKNVYVGTRAYMRANNFDTPVDNMDDSFLQSLGSIIYMGIESQLAAKLYIKYAINPAFEGMLRTLGASAICSGIKTYDPCINNDFIRAYLRNPECLFTVIKGKADSSTFVPKEELSSGIISANGEHSLLRAFILADKMRHTIRVNVVIKLISVIIGLAVSLFLLFSGTQNLNSLFILLFQMFWLASTIVTSYMYK